MQKNDTAANVAPLFAREVYIVDAKFLKQPRDLGQETWRPKKLHLKAKIKLFSVHLVRHTNRCLKLPLYWVEVLDQPVHFFAVV